MQLDEFVWGITLFYIMNVLTPTMSTKGVLKGSLMIAQMPKQPWDTKIKATMLFLKSPALCPTNDSTIRSFQIRS